MPRLTSSLQSQQLLALDVPLAARKHARPALANQPPVPQASAIPWTAEVQRAMLEQVLHDNKHLVARLQCRDKRAKLVPEEYVCPITYEGMQDPVEAEDGQTCKREAIATWVAGNGTSPFTRAPHGGSLQAAIERWQAK